MTHRDLTTPKSSSQTRHALRMFTLCVLLPCLALCAIGATAATLAQGAAVAPGHPHGSGVYAATEAPGVEICFPAAAWDAYAEDRPCDLLGRPQEDGSSTLRLGTMGADAAVCTVPNPYEERGTFTITCHRVPNR